ncbi:MAG TPA: NfeD family protein [Dehalococcoidales bacterium]|nr:NfeD family protein [Dehalococcoidales bacterium]
MAEFFAGYAIWVVWIIIGFFFLVFLATAPCHAAFILPFVGLPLFWLLPLGYALPINLVIWLASPLLYRAIRGAMKKPTVDGFRSLIGKQAKVVSRSETVSAAKYLVRARGEGELWSAYATDVLDIGEWVNIVAVKGIGVVVERGNTGSHPGETGNAKTAQPGVKADRGHCH